MLKPPVVNKQNNQRGLSRSPAKRKASRENLVKANHGKRKAAKVREIEHQLVNNREAWFKTKDDRARKALDLEFDQLLQRKNKLEA